MRTHSRIILSCLAVTLLASAAEAQDAGQISDAAPRPNTARTTHVPLMINDSTRGVQRVCDGSRALTGSERAKDVFAAAA